METRVRTLLQSRIHTGLYERDPNTHVVFVGAGTGLPALTAARAARVANQDNDQATPGTLTTVIPGLHRWNIFVCVAFICVYMHQYASK